MDATSEPKSPAQKVGAIAVTLIAFGILALRLYLPSKWEAKILSAEQKAAEAEAKRQAELEERLARFQERPEPEQRPPLIPVVPPTPSPVPQRIFEQADPPPHRAEGEEHLRRADQLFEKGDYPGAAEAYQQAERLAVWTPASRTRKKVCADIAYIVMYRDYLDREKILEPARLVGAKSNLGLINPATLPTDEWREEHRKTLARVVKEYKALVGEDRPRR